MRQCLLAIISLIGFFGVWSQEIEPNEDSVMTVKRLFQPRIYWDYGKTAMLWHPDFSKNEAGVELLLFDRLQLAAEAGIASFSPRNEYKNVDYSSEGSYWRLGAGLVGNIDLQSRIGIGGRYGRATFDDLGIVNIISASGFSEGYSEIHERKDLQADWFEIVIDSEKQIGLRKSDPSSILNRMFSVGIMFRYRVLLDAPSFDPVDVFAIPGYGRQDNKRVLAANLFLKINL